MKRIFFKKACNRVKKLMIPTLTLLAIMFTLGIGPAAPQEVLAATVGSSYTTMEIQTTQATFSSYWYQDSTGAWHIKDGSGNQIKNAWVCDNAVPSNGNNVWYLIDVNGNMITSGLVQDQTGNYYSLEVNHNGYYGMLRHESGNYDGISLTLNKDHTGSFASIQNQDGIQALQSKYGLTQVGIGNSNIVYTADFYKENSGAGVDTGKGNSGAGNRGNGTGYGGVFSDITDEEIRNNQITVYPDDTTFN